MNNGRRYSVEVKNKARKLRKQGFTHREIKKKLGISLGSLNLWTKGIILSEKQKSEIKKRWYKNYHNKFELYKEKNPQKIAESINRLKIYQYQRQYTKEDLLDKISNFYLRKGRIPLKREFGDPKTYRKYFGTWNNAIKLAGFRPNPVLFSYKFKSDDGHICDSFAEKIIDDWLYKRNIKHKRNFRYGNTKMTADFIIKPNIVVEFFGLAGVQKTYDEIIIKKRELCKNLGLKLIEIYPKDIIPKNRLSRLFRFR
ncbi:MAG: hypothetical protein V1868_01155 [Patescibacteria group bacterium]